MAQTYTWQKTILEGETVCLADIAEEIGARADIVGRAANINVVIHAALEGHDGQR